MIKNGKSYYYYPGCSLKGTGKHYEESVLSVFKALGISFVELPDWNCCGATTYMSINQMASYIMASRNLAIAERDGKDIFAPCSACYMVLLKTQYAYKNYPHVKEEIDKALDKVGLSYSERVRVRHPLDLIVTDVGMEEIKKKITRPFDRNLKVATYYGCLLGRPFPMFDHPCFPQAIDILVETLGAEAVEYPLKTRCCGGSLTGTIREVGYRLVYLLLKEAKKRGASAIVTVCPLCQFNLEAYQKEISKKYGEEFNMPILYFTQLLGLALGIHEKKLGLNRLLVSPEPVLNALP